MVTEATLQLSAVVGVPKVTPEAAAAHAPASAFTNTSMGAVMVGSWLSVTVTVKLASVELPAASRAVYVTVVVPRSKVEPEATEGVNEVTPQLSVAVGLAQFTTAVHTPPAVFTLMLLGIPAMTGA